MTLETMAPLSDNPIIMLSAVPGARPAQTEAGKHGATPKLHHAMGHNQRPRHQHGLESRLLID
jgi:hypothetical protein